MTRTVGRKPLRGSRRAHSSAPCSIALAAIAAVAAGCGPSGSSLEARLGAERRRLSRLQAREARARERPRPPELAGASRLSDYLAHGALRSPALEAAYNRWVAAVERVAPASALPDPRLSFAYFIREVETRVGPQQARLGLSQGLPWPGKRRLRGEAALSAAEAARESYEAARLRLFSGIAREFWEYWYLSRATGVTEENLKLLTYLEEVARRKFAAGVAPHSVVVKAQVELGRLEDRLTELRSLRGPMSARLAAAVGLRPGEPLPWPEEGPPEREAAKPEFKALREELLSANPDLRRAAAVVSRARRLGELARREGLPDVGVGLDYVFTGDPHFGSPPDGGADALALGLSMDLPINRGKYRAGVRAAAAERTAAELDLEDLGNRLVAELTLALHRFEDAGRKIGLYRDTLVPKARQAIEVTRQGFEADVADFLDLLDAERTLLEFELAAERARADRAIALAELSMLAGRDLARPGATPAEEETGVSSGEVSP